MFTYQDFQDCQDLQEDPLSQVVLTPPSFLGETKAYMQSMCFFAIVTNMPYIRSDVGQNVVPKSHQLKTIFEN